MQMGFVTAKMQSIFANKTENFSCGKMYRELLDTPPGEQVDIEVTT
jgi:hypothetical protein